MTHNRQGRVVSDSMRLKEFKKFLSTQPVSRPYRQYSYRGFEISGRASKWFVSNDPRTFSSKVKAEEAVDKCLSLREELARQ